MEFSHMSYKEIPFNEDNIFSANLMENNGFSKSSLQNLKYTQSVGYRFTKTLNLMFLYQLLKEKKLSAISEGHMLKKKPNLTLT